MKSLALLGFPHTAGPVAIPAESRSAFGYCQGCRARALADQLRLQLECLLTGAKLCRKVERPIGQATELEKRNKANVSVMWQEQEIEGYIKARLIAGDPQTGEANWSKYVTTRTDIVKNVLPYIPASEPHLTDHGTHHIGNVMRNVAQVLGIKSSDPIKADHVAGLTATEALALLMGCLLHDIGNIEGRDKHNQATSAVWRKSGSASWNSWSFPDRKALINICQAHTGKAEDGSADTLAPLASEKSYFLLQPIRSAQIAAILRFADELAEGEQRTSQYLLNTSAYPEGNEIYHEYAKITQINIDRASARIAIDYSIDLRDEFFGDSASAPSKLRSLLELIYQRVVKLERERLFARHYAPEFLQFRETSVVVHMHDDYGNELKLPSLVLNDFNVRELHGSQIPNLNNSYDIDKIVSELGNLGILK